MPGQRAWKRCCTSAPAACGRAASSRRSTSETVPMRRKRPSLRVPPALMISSCRRCPPTPSAPPPSTRMRPWAMTAGVSSALSGSSRAVTRCRRLRVSLAQSSARSRCRHICTRRWLRWASTTSSRPLRQGVVEDDGPDGAGVRVLEALGAVGPAAGELRQAEHRAAAALAARVRP